MVVILTPIVLMVVGIPGNLYQFIITRKHCSPGDSIRDLFIPDRWRSRLQPLKGSRFHHPKKVTSRIARLLFFKMQNHEFLPQTSETKKQKTPKKTLTYLAND